MRNIRFRLIVIVITHKILHRVFRKKFLEFRTQLRSQSFVVSQHQSRALQPLDNFCHGKGLAGAGHAQQRLLPQAPLHALHQLFNGLRLIARGLVRAD